MRSFSLIGLFFGITIFLCVILLIPYIKLVFFLGIAEVRKAAVEGEPLIVFPARSLQAYAYRYINIIYPLSYVFLLMFFYSLSFYKKKKLVNTFLFLASFCGIVVGVFNGGRTNVIYWIQAFSLLFLVFYPYISIKKRIALFTIAGISLAAIVTYFLVVSLSRFGEDESESELIRYAGTSFLNFCDFIQRYNADHFSLRRIFPFLSELFGGEMDISTYRDMVYKKSHMEIGLFYTMLGDLYVDVGYIGMLMYTVLFKIISGKFIPKMKYTFSSLLVFLVIFLIPLQGLFYYSYWHSAVTKCSIGIIVYALYIKKNYHA